MGDWHRPVAVYHLLAARCGDGFRGWVAVVMSELYARWPGSLTRGSSWADGELRQDVEDRVRRVINERDADRRPDGYHAVAVRWPGGSVHVSVFRYGLIATPLLIETSTADPDAGDEHTAQRAAQLLAVHGWVPHGAWSHKAAAWRVEVRPADGGDEDDRSAPKPELA